MKVLLIDSHTLFREGLRHILQQLPDGVSQILEAGSFSEGLLLAKTHSGLDLVLLELKSPGCEGISSVTIFRQYFPHVPLVVVSSEEDCHVIKAVFDQGADGFVCKSSGGSTLLRAISLVLAGSLYIPEQLLHPIVALNYKKMAREQRKIKAHGYSLTARQMDVLKGLTTGLSNKEISKKINVAEGTVKVHIAAVYQTLGVKKRIDAVQVAKLRGLTETILV